MSDLFPENESGAAGAGAGRTVKCLSVMQPFAALIMDGHKRFETRSWSTGHRGLLAIHTGLDVFTNLSPRARPIVIRLLGADWAATVPRGALLGLVELRTCLSTNALGVTLDPQEIALGHFGPDRWAWQLEAVHALPVPVPWRGGLGLFDVPREKLEIAD